MAIPPPGPQPAARAARELGVLNLEPNVSGGIQFVPPDSIAATSAEPSERTELAIPPLANDPSSRMSVFYVSAGVARVIRGG